MLCVARHEFGVIVLCCKGDAIENLVVRVGENFVALFGGSDPLAEPSNKVNDFIGLPGVESEFATVQNIFIFCNNFVAVKGDKQLRQHCMISAKCRRCWIRTPQGGHENICVDKNWEELGTGPAIANKIKGLRGFGGGTGAVVQICHCQYYTENSILLV